MSFPLAMSKTSFTGLPSSYEFTGSYHTTDNELTTMMMWCCVQDSVIMGSRSTVDAVKEV